MFSYKSIKISDHAVERARERFGLSPSQIAEKAWRSLEDGLDVLSDPTLRKTCLAKAERHNSSGMYLYEGIVFAFCDEVVATVYPVSIYELDAS
nr:hypothetical protein BdHM001_35790 [Bdellovibrio sp. HM001]